MVEERWMSLRAYAAHRGVTLSTVQKAIESGRVTAVRRDEGTGHLKGIEQVAADAQWAENTDPVEAGKNGKVLDFSQSGGVAASADVKTGAKDSAVAGEDPPQGPPAGSAGAGGKDKDPHGFYASRARRMEFDAADRELDVLERAGSLISAKEVEDMVFGIFRQVRDRLQNIPARIGPRVAAESDPGRVDKLISDEVALVLDELSRDIEDLATERPGERESAAVPGDLARAEDRGAAHHQPVG